MKNDLIRCPCKRIKCERYGNCAACKQHHHAPNKKLLPACERIVVSKEKRKATAQYDSTELRRDLTANLGEIELKSNSKKK